MSKTLKIQKKLKKLEQEMIDAMLKGENYAPGAYQKYCDYQEELRKEKIASLVGSPAS